MATWDEVCIEFNHRSQLNFLGLAFFYCWWPWQETASVDRDHLLITTHAVKKRFDEDHVLLEWYKPERIRKSIFTLKQTKKGPTSCRWDDTKTDVKVVLDEKTHDVQTKLYFLKLSKFALLTEWKVDHVQIWFVPLCPIVSHCVNCGIMLQVCTVRLMAVPLAKILTW